MGGPLAEGKIEGFEVQCPWHGSKFDIRYYTWIELCIKSGRVNHVSKPVAFFKYGVE